MIRIIPCVLALVAVGCNDGSVTAVNCTDVGAAAMAITLQDSVTGAQGAFHDVVGIARDGTFRDSVRLASVAGTPTEPTGIPLAFGRSGTYDVEVRAAGYLPWKASAVDVDEEPVCHHVMTRFLTARLVPTASGS